LWKRVYVEMILMWNIVRTWISLTPSLSLSLIVKQVVLHWIWWSCSTTNTVWFGMWFLFLPSLINYKFAETWRIYILYCNVNLQ
jgi:hypothetical protein